MNDWLKLHNIRLSSDTHYIVVDLLHYGADIYSKTDDTYVEYMNTHSFYKNDRGITIKNLKKLGFDLDLWEA